MLIASYSVSVHRAQSAANAGASQCRVMILRTLSPTGGAAAMPLVISFFEHDPATLGRVKKQEGIVQVCLPARDFEDLYRIVQTESPVYANWQTDGEGNLLNFMLGTDEEPTGEGHIDKSG